MIRAQLFGGDAAARRIDALRPKLFAAISSELQRQTFALEAYVKGSKLSGQVLHVRTGNLRNSVNSKFTHNGNVLVGSVGSGIEYAAYQEYGFDGQVTRRVTQVFGRALADPITVSYKVNYPAHSFLRSALRERKPQILSAFEAAVRRGLEA